jgi:UDP-3-O-[3-hydroxymyristoyl] glucosamine N-acyltransferase
VATNVETICGQLHGELRGDRQLVIDGAQSIDKAGLRDITFVADVVNLRKLKDSGAGAVLVSRLLSDSLAEMPLPPAVIIVDDAQTAFLQVLERFRPPRARPTIGISPAATVNPTAQIGENTNIYPGAYLGNDVVIGNNCDIFPGVFIGPGCRLGDEVTLYPNAVLYADVCLGHRVTVHAASVLGADGFGYRLVDGRHQKIPHFGTVHVGDDVEIGACTTIDRAMIGATVIGEGTKLDNLVMIGHNCELGRHNVMVSQVALAGSVTTEDYVVCAGQVGVVEHVHLGEGCVLGSKAGALKDVPAGQTYIGVPAQPVVEAMKNVLAQRKVPEMQLRIRHLEKQIAELEEKLEVLSVLEPPGLQTPASNSAA